MKVPARSILLLVVLLFASHAMGTAQAPDVLLIDGKPASLHTNPLNEWLRTHPDSLPRSEVQSTGNWRGYIATWEVDKGKLWLRKVEITVQEGTRPRESTEVVERNGKFEQGETRITQEPNFVQRDVMAGMFPDTRDVVASWFSGTLIVPRGDLVEYVHMGYGSTYEGYTIVWIRNGEVSRRLDLDAEQFREFRQERFAAFKQTEAYRNSVASLGAASPEETDRFLFEFHTEQYLSE